MRFSCVGTTRHITGGLNDVCALRLNMSVSDINSSGKEGLILSTVDTSMCHSQRRDASSLGPRKQIHASSLFLLFLSTVIVLTVMTPHPQARHRRA